MKVKSILVTVMLIAALTLLVLNSRSHSQDGSSPFSDFYGPQPATIEDLIAQYVELSTQLASRMTQQELETAIVEMTRELDDRNADDKIQSARDLLQGIIESHPDSPAAEAARNALEGLERSVENPGDPFFENEPNFPTSEPGAADESDFFPNGS